MIGLLIRNSTARQVGNYREEEQFDMGPLLLARGFDVKAFEEQGVSGSDLSKRKATNRMLDELRAGLIQGIAALDVKRLTRDQFGVDGGEIAEAVVDAGGLLVTKDKTYDLRNEDDLLHFQFQCMLAGIDWRTIRNTFWSGIFKKLEHEPMFNRPPLGYMTEYVPGDRPGRILKRPAKNPEHAALMDELGDAFEACKTLGQVIRRMRDAGFERPPVRYRDTVASHWTVQGLRYMLWKNPIYYGVFEFGGPTRKNGKKRSVVWHKYGRDEAGAYRVFRHEVPDLAYWSATDIRRWRAKFATKQEGPVIRTRKHDHPFLGVLVCIACGAPMIGAGKDGYVCRSHRTSGCAQPQKLAEHIVLALLRTVLEETLGTTSDLAARAEQEVAMRRPSDKALQLASAQTRSASLAKVIARMDNPSEDLIKELDDLQGTINRLREDVADELAEQQSSDEMRAAMARLRDTPLAVFEQLTPEQQARVYAMLFTNVRIGYSGRASGRRWWLESFEPLFGEGRIDVLHPHVARVLPWELSGKLGLPSLRVDPPGVNGTVNVGNVHSGRAISAYISRLRSLSEILSAAAS